MAAAIADGERYLAPWPTELADGDMWYYPQATAAAAAAAALAALSTTVPPTVGVEADRW